MKTTEANNTKIIGNIVTLAKKTNFSPLFNVCDSMSDIVEGVPTMIIGLELAKVNLGKRFSIIQKEYPGDVRWTYKKTERNYEYETDMLDFYRKCLNDRLESIRYIYADVIRYKYLRLKSLIQFINNRKHKICFLTRDRNFLFIYSPSDEIVAGISLTLLEYCGIPKDKCVRKVKANKNNVFVKDTSFISSDIRAVMGNNTHYIPVLDYLFSKS